MAYSSVVYLKAYPLSSVLVGEIHADSVKSLHVSDP